MERANTCSVYAIHLKILRPLNKIRFEFRNLSGALRSKKTRGIDSLIRCHILLEPSHGRTVVSVLDDAGIAIRGPSGTIDVAPHGNACDILCVPEFRNLFRIALLLEIVIIGADIIFGDEQRNADSVVDFFERGLEVGDIHIGQIVRLLSVRIHRSASLPDLVDEGDTFIDLPLEGVVIVVNKDSLRPAFARHLKGSRHKCVIIIVSAQSLPDLGLFVAGMIRVRSSANRLIHHVDHFEIRKIRLYSIEPSSNGRFRIRSAQVGKPVRVLGAPNQGVELEMSPVVLGPIVSILATFKVVVSSRTFDGAPFAFIFSRDLIPVRAEIRTNLAIRSNVAKKFRSSVRQRRGAGSSGENSSRKKKE